MLLFLLSFLSALVRETVAFRPRLPLNGDLTKRQASINTSGYPALTVSLPLDHFNATDTRQFSNRYWINSTFYSPGGPVFYFDSGEQNAHPLVPYFLAEAAGPSSVMTLARRFGGIAVLFEHRFYGDLTEGSFPFPINSTTGRADGGYEAYKYLNTEQALSDPVYFANNFQPPGLEQYWPALSSNATPWIWLGGSYPGVRGTHLRVRNPETFYATWASSAPTEAAVDMWVYYAQAERSMTRNCSADYTAVTNYVDAVLANGTAARVSDLKYDLYRAILSGPDGQAPEPINRTESDSLSNQNVGNYLLTPLSFYQYYGFNRSVLPFCDILETQNYTAPAPSSSLTSTYNISTTWSAFLTGLAEIDYDSVPYNDDPISDISWTWQYCSEYGYYQRGNPDNPHTIQSRYISLDTFQRSCNRAFPFAPPSPNVAAPNKYGGWNINPSNTMFTSGEFDPWRTYSPASTESELGAPLRQTVQDIPECGVAPPQDQIFGMVHQGMVHVSDMRALLNTSDVNHQNFSTVGFSSPISTEPFYAGVELFGNALEKWLPCFRNGTGRTRSDL